MKPWALAPPTVLACAVLLGCSGSNSGGNGEAQEFLRTYEAVARPLGTIAAEAGWRAATDINDRNVGERIGAEKALAAFRGSGYVIETSRRLLGDRDALSELEFRQIDKILLSAAESPGTIPEVVRSLIETKARISALVDGYQFCLEKRTGRCPTPLSSEQIDRTLLSSVNLVERRRVWEASKHDGPELKKGLEQLRDLRNRVATELGYSSYFHLQVADYGMNVAEMMGLMDRVLADTGPLYRQLHLYARRRLAARYRQPAPDRIIPAHWLGNRWGQSWPGLAEGPDLEPEFREKTPEWIVQQAERFYGSLGWPALPESFWKKSDLYLLPPGSSRVKSARTRTWHIDLDQDVRSLMNIGPSLRWFAASHRELGHAYYHLACSNPKVPVVLREGANRAFLAAVGELAAAAARQEPYLHQIGILPAGRNTDPNQRLLNEALEGSMVFLPWSAGTVTHFEHDLYEKKLPIDQFNRRWWEMAVRYQGIQPPAPRGEEFCDACSQPHLIEDAAQYYDHALAAVIKYQLHDYIARKILHRDPHECNYYGNKEVGEWLWEIMSLGSTRSWRQVLRERTGEEISSRALVDYFRPLQQYLERVNSSAE